MKKYSKPTAEIIYLDIDVIMKSDSFDVTDDGNFFDGGGDWLE